MAARGPNRYALLIGINAYRQNPLDGCVPDIQRMQAYLKKSIKKPPPLIQTLTATRDPATDAVIETPNFLPTLDNTIVALERITDACQAGDVVYIHYSGHGTREPPSDEFSNHSTGDLIMVLVEGDNADEESYFHGSHLAYHLKTMVDKGVAVTLVLDCCFSGSVNRETVRFTPYNPEVAAKCPTRFSGEVKLAPTSHTKRAASMLPNWMVNPDGYAILSACGAHETAKELTAKGQKFGALSYLLRMTLSETSGVSSKHQHIFSLVRARFRKSWPKQTPILFGNKHQCFFDQHVAKSALSSIAVMQTEESIQLPLGQAHGVSVGDTFVLQRPNAQDEDTSVEDPSSIVVVTTAGPLTSTVEYQDGVMRVSKASLTAKPKLQNIFHNFPIQLASSIPSLEDWLVELEKRSLIAHSEPHGGAFAFQVVLTDTEYEIRDETGREVQNLPPLLREDSEVSYISDILEHLVRFRLLVALENKTPTYLMPESFSAHIITQDASFGPENTIELEHDTWVHLTVENNSQKPLYSYVYSLGQNWQAVNIYKGTYEVIPPKSNDGVSSGEARRKIHMTVPDEMQEIGFCDDIIKIFLTTQPTAFDILELPALNTSAKRPERKRSAPHDGQHAPEDWVALTFTIRTSIKPAAS